MNTDFPHKTSTEDFKDKHITIIGLGLIGGSLARAFHERCGINHITAVDNNQDSLESALMDQVISKGFSEINEDVLSSDIILLCTPVKKTIQYLKDIADKVKPGCIITDVGSTKVDIIEYVNSMKNPPCFIGGHPMTGSEKTGYGYGSSHLFENAYYILSPSKSTDKSHIDFMKKLVKAIGGMPVVLDAYEHDKITGSISHVPHVIASALVNMVKSLETSDGKMQMLAAGGFKDITRIASSSPEMWESIISSNSAQIEKILCSYISILEDFRHHVQKNNTEEIHEFFSSAKEFRDNFVTIKTSKSIKGLIDPTFEIIVDVVDKPGIIGEIATILGSNGVNIKNIHVSNSREFEQGCLIITLPDSESVNIAFDLLSSKGYKIYKTN